MPVVVNSIPLLVACVVAVTKFQANATEGRFYFGQQLDVRKSWWQMLDEAGSFTLWSGNRKQPLMFSLLRKSRSCHVYSINHHASTWAGLMI